jgi:1-deoxy-D-xylulose-5-phosphate synthase
MVVMAPKDENELRDMIYTAIHYPGPIAFRYPRGAAAGIPLKNSYDALPIGKGEILTDGGDLVILAIGTTVNDALNARNILADQKNIHSTVVNCRYVKPLDTELICSLAEKIPKVITVEENVRQGGFGSAVLEMFADKGLSGVQTFRMGIPDSYIEHGPRNLLKNKYGLDAEAIVNAAVRLLTKGNP